MWSSDTVTQSVRCSGLVAGRTVFQTVTFPSNTAVSTSTGTPVWAPRAETRHRAADSLIGPGRCLQNVRRKHVRGCRCIGTRHGHSQHRHDADGLHGNGPGVNIAPSANLRGADLTDFNLAGADLSGVNLTNATLNGAVLNGANLTGANLTGANLTGADLTEDPARTSPTRF